MYPNYEASNRGRIRSLKWGRPHVLKAHKDADGYLRVQLYVKRRKYHIQVHRLVGLAFLPLLEGRLQVNHINGDKLNNTITNLEACTLSENVKHAWRTGLTRGRPVKLSAEDVKEIRFMLSRGQMQKDIAKRFGVTPSMVSSIKRGQSWVT